MRKFFISTVVALGCIALTACGNSSSSTSADQSANTGKQEAAVSSEKITLKFGNTAGEEDIQTIALRDVAERLEKESNGRIVAEVYPSSSLGDTDDLTEQAMQGAAILTVSDPSRLASFVNDYGMLQMPYIFDDYSGLDKVMKTALYDEWKKQFADQGIWLITSNWFSGTRNFCLNKEIKNPEDLTGQRIRTIGNDLCTSSVNAMGAVATPMSWSEVYTSIQQKALDGAEVQTPSFYATRLWEVTKYINKTEHFQLIGSVVTGTKFRDSLSKEDQELVERIFREVGTEYQAKCIEMSDNYEKEMVEKYGVIINNDVNIQAFKDATAPVYAQLGYEDVKEELMKEMAQ
ncbi:MAG: C4-dicarboxylate TRAP transporter substrate-binding protein [Lachnospiraceae bacterium]|nr:C4-dicarboxylate TRAP transporter substrate-binding protein [Lachnospiraceae bacterium]